MCEEMAGQHGSARRVPVEGGLPAQLATWIVTAPIWHPLWSQYMIAVVSLADLPDHAPAYLQFPEATHELLVIALNPDKGPYDAASISASNPVSILEPLNIIEQFIATDEQAILICHGLAHGVCDGMLNPETSDAPARIRSYWAQAVSQSLDHFRDPAHGRMN